MKIKIEHNKKDPDRGVHGELRRNEETAERNNVQIPRRKPRNTKNLKLINVQSFLKRIKSQIISSQNIYVTQLIEMISSLGLAA